MSASPPPAPSALPRLKLQLHYMSGYEHFIQHIEPRIRVSNPGIDKMEVFMASSELWTTLAPCERMYWDKVASDYWDKYEKDIMLVLYEYPQNFELYLNTPNAHFATTHDAEAQGTMAQGSTAQSASAQDATAQGRGQGAMAQGATAQDRGQGAMARGATAQDRGQGAIAQGATAQGRGQGAMAQSYWSNGATAQGRGQGAVAQGATAQDRGQGAMAQGATAQDRGQGVMAQGATAQDRGQGAMAQGATAQDRGQSAMAQGATAQDRGQGAMAQGATAQDKGQGVMAQGATAQDRGQGALAQGAKAQDRGQGAMAHGYWGKGATAQDYRAADGAYQDMEATASYKSYLYYGDDTKPEVRRFFLDDLESYQFEPLQTTVRHLYNLKSLNFSIAWKDEDGDEVVMSSDAEVRTMISEGQDRVIKLVVRCENDARAQPFPEDREAAPETVTAASTATNQGDLPAAVHKGVTCDGCGHAVVGHRYKCISCDNYDLCAKCETGGKHSHHCVVRVPHPNMSVPLLKASIKKSRRFLKSVTANAIEENKKLRRERRHSAEPNAQATQDSQPRTSISWMEIVNKYVDEFTNIAGNMAYCPERGTATTEAATSTEPRSGETAMNVPTGDQIDRNPGQFEQMTMRLQRAAKLISALDPSHAFAPEMDLKNGSANQTQVENDIAEAGPAPRDEAGPAPREEAMNPEANREQQGSPKTYQTAGQPELASTQAALSDTAKMTQITKTVQGTTEAKEIYVKNNDISELANAVKMCEMSSNASSCSEGSGYEKADGWTVVNAENLKDENQMEEHPMDGQEPIRQQAPIYPPLNADTAEWKPMEEDSMGGQEPIRQHVPIYPPLNAATAVFNPRDSDVAPASAAPTAAPKREAAKKATSAGAAIAEDLRSQIAPHVEAALHQMEQMGFSNESGWLTQLLDHHDGNIAVVLDLIAPIKGPNAPSVPNAPNARPK